MATTDLASFLVTQGPFAVASLALGLWIVRLDNRLQAERDARAADQAKYQEVILSFTNRGFEAAERNQRVATRVVGKLPPRTRGQDADE